MSELPMREMGKRPRRPAGPLQFGLRHMLLAVSACCIVLAASVQWGALAGFLLTALCLVLGIRLYTRSAEHTAAIVGWCFFPLVLIMLFALCVYGGSPSAEATSGYPGDKTESTEPQTERFQFSLRSLFLLIATTSVVLAVGVQWDKWVGYWLGVACSLVVFWVYKPKRKAIPAFIILLEIAVLTGLLLHGPARIAFTSATRQDCSNNLRAIAIAILNYEVVHGSLPPAYTTDSTGRRLHSWRTLILPLGEEKALYSQIDQCLPWNDPANLPYTNQPLDWFQCRANPKYRQGSFTSYVAVLGDETMWPGEQGRQLSDVTDGAENTLLVIEVARTDIAWAEPRDLTLDEVLAAHRRGEVTGIAGFHTGGVVSTVTSDVHTPFIDPYTIDEQTLRALFTVAGGEVIHFEDLSQPPLTVPSADEGGRP